MSVRLRLLLLAAIPLLGFILLAGSDVLDKRRMITQAEGIIQFSKFAKTIGEVVHELQRERGFSAVFITSGGKEGADALAGQHPLTDDAEMRLATVLAGFDAGAFTAELRENIDKAMVALAGLDSHRALIKAGNVTAADSYNYFSATIANLLKPAALISSLANDAEISKDMAAYVSYLRAKEAAGQERATGVTGIAPGRFPYAVYMRYLRVVGNEETFLGLFEDIASPEAKAFRAETVTGKPVEEVERMRAIAIKGGLVGDLKGVTAAHWFEAATARIDLMKKVEDFISAELDANSMAMLGAAKRGALIDMALIGVVLFISLGAAFVNTRRILRQLGGEPAYVLKIMRAVADGDLGITIDVMRGDETSLLAGLKGMVIRLRRMMKDIHAASEVGLYRRRTGCLELRGAIPRRDRANIVVGGCGVVREANGCEHHPGCREHVPDRAACTPIGRERADERCGRGPGGYRHADDRREDPDRAGARAANRSARPQRGGGSCARRRTRPGLCGGRIRGAQARRAQPGGGAGDFQPLVRYHERRTRSREDAR